MNEVKIQIPDNCELIKDGNTYIVKEKEEKKQTPPRSWEEFCKRYPKQKGECFIGTTSVIRMYDETRQRYINHDKNLCVSKEEAEAFLALMQLRQLRKAWVGDWEIPVDADYGIIFTFRGSLATSTGCTEGRALSFPTRKMAGDFLSCFKDLCEQAKILL